jgi:hypothetical protein
VTGGGVTEPPAAADAPVADEWITVRVEGCVGVITRCREDTENAREHAYSLGTTEDSVATSAARATGSTDVESGTAR